MSLGVISSHASIGVSSAYAAAVLADSPLAYYRLGDASGTTMTDSSGNGRNGTYDGTVTLGTAGLLTGDPDTAFTVNGANGRGLVADAAWMDSTNFSIESWIKTSTTGVYQYIATRDTQGRLWEYRLTNGGVLQFEGVAGGLALNTAVALNDGVRHHVVATYDGANVRLYVDGSLAVTSGSYIVPNTNVGTADFSIGAGKAGTGGWANHPFIGVIDEVAFYGTTLSGARIAAHYAAA